jgi:hypothetical protein
LFAHCRFKFLVLHCRSSESALEVCHFIC